MDDLLAAETELEQAWCDLDREWHRLLQEAHEEGVGIVHDAETEAAHVVRDAHVEATSIVDMAQAEAAALLLEAQEQADRIVAEARRAPLPAAAVEDPTGIREALQRLRTELSGVVDAALDAFPAIEATADLFAAPAPPPEPVIDLTEPAPVVRRPGRVRRLLRLA